MEDLLFAELIHLVFELCEQIVARAYLLFDAFRLQFEQGEGFLWVKHVDPVVKGSAEDWVKGDFECFVGNDRILSVHFSEQGQVHLGVVVQVKRHFLRHQHR